MRTKRSDMAARVPNSEVGTKVVGVKGGRYQRVKVEESEKSEEKKKVIFHGFYYLNFGHQKKD